MQILQIIGCVHDEIILEVEEGQSKKAATVLKQIMEEAGRFFLKTIPVVADVSITDSWADK